MSDTAYVIRCKRHFYGPSEEYSLEPDEDGWAEVFGTRHAARDRIAQLDGGVYVTAHNESSRPDYRVARVDTLPEYLLAMVR